MSETSTSYLTTPIYYVNDVPHPGHAYTTIAADALARARRLQGRRVFFLTGTDEHGQNIARIARAKGVPEQDYCDEIAARFKALWTRLDIRYDGFIRTTDAVHIRGVLKLWERLSAAQGPDGQPVIYRGRYKGWYCPRCEGFKTEGELQEPEHLCAVHERPCEWMEEENFFFRLSAYQGWLEEQILAGSIRIDPVGRRNEVLAVLRQGLQDFSISRARVKWGIKVPEEPSHVFYVWMDALANYITALGFDAGGELYRTFWEEAGERFHLIGKEIIRFHCLYWPAMLQAAGLPVPTRLFAHGWLTKDGKKMSKTTGNIIDADKLIDLHGPDAVRYFLLREGTFGQDWDFTDAAFVKRYNSDLANDLGNLVSRATTMVSRYCEGRVPERPEAPKGEPRGLEERLQPRGAGGEPHGLERGVLGFYDEVDYARALGEIWDWIGQLNRRIVAEAPWEMAKDPARKGELEAFLYRLLEAIRLIGLLVSPVMPRAAVRLLGMLGLEEEEPGPQLLKWGLLEPGSALGPVEPLFPRVETPGSARSKEKPVSETKPSPATEPKIDIADFAKLELKVARITAAEKIAGSKKLIKMEVDLGGETRQLVAGIAEAYEAESLPGKMVVVVANLKPAKLMGVESNGMVLAASVKGQPILCTFDEPVAPGAKVR